MVVNTEVQNGFGAKYSILGELTFSYILFGYQKQP